MIFALVATLHEAVVAYEICNISCLGLPLQRTSDTVQSLFDRSSKVLHGMIPNFVFNLPDLFQRPLKKLLLFESIELLAIFRPNS